MLDTLSSLAPMAAPAMPPAQQPNAGGNGESRAFARELERARPIEHSPAPQASVNAQAHAGPRPPSKAAHGSASTAPPPHGKAAAAAARSRSEPSPRQHADVKELATGPHDTEAGESLATEDATAVADLNSLFASLMPTAMVPAIPARGAAGDADETEARAVGARHRTSAQETRDPLMAAPVDASLTPGTIATEADTGTDGKGTLREDTAGSAPPPASSHAEAAVFTLPQPMGTAPSSLPRAEAAAPAPAPYAAQIAAPVGSPDFAPGLSAHLSVMVRDGLQEARLQLNPAEMGPITVQIQLDGQKAQVTMVAEQAPTRQALEQAMPTLASALREGGLTLTGGGVFEQAPSNAQQQQQQHQAQAQRDAAASRRGGSQQGSDDDPLVAPAIPAVRASSRRGVLDLYA